MNNHIMIVLETSGTNGLTAAILELTAIRFNPITGEFSPDHFQQPIKFKEDREFEPATLNWWMRRHQTKDHIMMLNQDGRPFEKVWAEFLQWCQPIDELHFWAKPSHFVWPFIESYCHQYDQVNPFAHFNVHDVNSFIEGLHFPTPPPPFEDVGGTQTFSPALVRGLMNIKLLQDSINA